MSHDAGGRCVCVADHRPRPLELHLHHVWPLYLGGPDQLSNCVWLCPSSHVSVHEVLRTLMQVGPMRWGLAQEQWPGLNRYVHHIAHEGYRRWHENREAA